MTEILPSLLIFLGSLVVFIAGVGAYRFPDTLTRMAALSTATTLGALLIGLGAACEPSLSEVRTQSIFICVFLFIANPVASHLIGRVGLQRKMPIAPATQRRDLRD